MKRFGREELQQLLLLMLENANNGKDGEAITKGEFFLGVIALQLVDINENTRGLKNRLSDIVGRLEAI
jgi:hypothetical protein